MPAVSMSAPEDAQLHVEVVSGSYPCPQESHSQSIYLIALRLNMTRTLLSWAQMIMIPLPMRTGEFHAYSQAASADSVSSVRESTASLISSIFEYCNFHGRTYQSSSTTEYWYVYSPPRPTLYTWDSYLTARASNDDKYIEAFNVG